jgi:tetratricopeptide (TPR) repeat protein
VVGEGFLLRSLGLLRAKRGLGAEGRALLLEAIDLHERNMDQVSAARVHLDLAQLLAEQGERAQAVELAEQAVSTFGERRASELDNARRILERISDPDYART